MRLPTPPLTPPPGEIADTRRASTTITKPFPTGASNMAGWPPIPDPSPLPDPPQVPVPPGPSEPPKPEPPIREPDDEPFRLGRRGRGGLCRCRQFKASCCITDAPVASLSPQTLVANAV